MVTKKDMALLAGAAGYANCISAGRGRPLPNVCSGYNTEQCDGEPW